MLDDDLVQGVNYHLFDLSKPSFVINIRWLSEATNLQFEIAPYLHTRSCQARIVGKSFFIGIIGRVTYPYSIPFLELVHFHLLAEERDICDWIANDLQDSVLTSLLKLRSLGLLVLDFSEQRSRFISPSFVKTISDLSTHHIICDYILLANQ